MPVLACAKTGIHFLNVQFVAMSVPACRKKSDLPKALKLMDNILVI